jgi:hypothetical protein
MLLVKKTFFLLLPSLLCAEKIYEAQLSEANRLAMQNKKIKCRLVCDKKLYKEQKIAEAISFYKKSKYYKFEKKAF